MPTWTSDRRLYVNADRSAVVPGDSQEAAYLLVAEGGELPLAEAERYGLLGDKAVAGPPANKAQPAPANRARSAPSDRA